MPVTYTIDQEAGLVRMRCWGTFTDAEMLESVEQLHSDPARRPGMHSLIDCRGVQEMQVTPAGLAAAATIENVLIDPAQEPWAVAIIASQDEVFRAARTYEVLRSGSPEKVRVFRDAAEAEDWLHRQSAD